MAIVFKVDVLTALKEAGYNTSKIRNDKIMGEAMLQKLRNNELPSWSVFNTLCSLLECQPADLIEYVQDK
jgi:putative transcriptional regulator